MVGVALEIMNISVSLFDLRAWLADRPMQCMCGGGPCPHDPIICPKLEVFLLRLLAGKKITCHHPMFRLPTRYVAFSIIVGMQVERCGVSGWPERVGNLFFLVGFFCWKKKRRLCAFVRVFFFWMTCQKHDGLKRVWCALLSLYVVCAN